MADETKKHVLHIKSDLSPEDLAKFRARWRELVSSSPAWRSVSVGPALPNPVAISQPWKTLGFIWDLPITILGLLYMLLLMPRWSRWEPEDWSLHFFLKEGSYGQKLLRRFNVGAQTIGNVVVYVAEEYAAATTLMSLHERAHVRQGMRFGVFHPVFYGFLSLLSWAYGQDIYRGNDAEEQARADSGEVPQPADIAPKDHSGGKL